MQLRSFSGQERAEPRRRQPWYGRPSPGCRDRSAISGSRRSAPVPRSFPRGFWCASRLSRLPRHRRRSLTVRAAFHLQIRRGKGKDAYPRAIAAFGRECMQRGVPPPTINLFGAPFLTWRGLPLVPSDKLKITEATNGTGKTHGNQSQGNRLLSDLALLFVGDPDRGCAWRARECGDWHLEECVFFWPHNTLNL
jgi:hypothetical protein